MKKAKFFHGKGLFRFLREKLMKPSADDSQDGGVTGNAEVMTRPGHDPLPRPPSDISARPLRDNRTSEAYPPVDRLKINEKSKTVTENIMALVSSSPNDDTKISEVSDFHDRRSIECSGFSHTYTLHTPHDIHTDSFNSRRGIPQTYTLKTTSDEKDAFGLETEATTTQLVDDKPLLGHVIKKINKPPIVRVLSNNPNSPYALNVTEGSRTVFVNPKQEKLSKMFQISKRKRNEVDQVNLQNYSKQGRTQTSSGYKKSKDLPNYEMFDETKHGDEKITAGKNYDKIMRKKLYDQQFSVDSHDDEFSFDLRPNKVNSSLYKTPADTDNTIVIETVSGFTHTRSKEDLTQLENSAAEITTLIDDTVDMGPVEQAVWSNDVHSSESDSESTKGSLSQNSDTNTFEDNTILKHSEPFCADKTEVDDDDSITLRDENQLTKSKSQDPITSIHFSTESNTLVDTEGSKEFGDTIWQDEKKLSTDTLLHMVSRVLQSRASHMDNPHDRLKEMFRRALWKNSFYHGQEHGGIDIKTESDTHSRLKSSSESDISEIPSHMSHAVQSSREKYSDRYGKSPHISTRKTRENPIQKRKHYATVAKRTRHLDSAKKLTNSVNSEENTEVTTNSIWNSTSSLQKNNPSKSQSNCELHKEDLYQHVIAELFQDFTQKFSEKLQSGVPRKDQLSDLLDVSKHDDEENQSVISSQSNESEYSGLSQSSTCELKVDGTKDTPKEVGQHVANKDKTARQESNISISGNDNDGVSSESNESESEKSGQQNNSILNLHSIYKENSDNKQTSGSIIIHKDDPSPRNYRVFEKKSFKLTPIQVNIFDKLGKTDIWEEDNTTQEYTENPKSNIFEQKTHIRKGHQRSQAKHRYGRTPNRQKERSKTHILPSSSIPADSNEESIIRLIEKDSTSKASDEAVIKGESGEDVKPNVDDRSSRSSIHLITSGEDVKPHLSNISNRSTAAIIDSGDDVKPQTSNRSSRSSSLKVESGEFVSPHLAKECSRSSKHRVESMENSIPRPRHSLKSALSIDIPKRGNCEENSSSAKSSKVDDCRIKESTYSNIKPMTLKQECEKSLEASFNQRSMAFREKTERADKSIQKSLNKLSLLMHGASKRVEHPDNTSEPNVSKTPQLPIRPLGGCRGRQCSIPSPSLSPAFKR